MVRRKRTISFAHGSAKGQKSRLKIAKSGEKKQATAAAAQNKMSVMKKLELDPVQQSQDVCSDGIDNKSSGITKRQTRSMDKNLHESEDYLKGGTGAVQSSSEPQVQKKGSTFVVTAQGTIDLEKYVFVFFSFDVMTFNIYYVNICFKCVFTAGKFLKNFIYMYAQLQNA